MDAAFNLNRSIAGFHAADVLRAVRVVNTPGALVGINSSAMGCGGGSLKVAGNTAALQPRCTISASVSSNETAAAVLAAALISETPLAPDSLSSAGSPSLGSVAVLSTIASWESIAVSERFPFNTGCLLLNYSGNPGVNYESYRGANGKRSGQASPRYDMSSYFSFVWGALRSFDLPDMLAALRMPALVLEPLDAERRPLNASAIASAYSFAEGANPQLTVHGGDVPGDVTARLLSWLQANTTGHSR